MQALLLSRKTWKEAGNFGSWERNKELEERREATWLCGSHWWKEMCYVYMTSLSLWGPRREGLAGSSVTQDWHTANPAFFTLFPGVSPLKHQSKRPCHLLLTPRRWHEENLPSLKHCCSRCSDTCRERQAVWEEEGIRKEICSSVSKNLSGTI